MFNGEQLRNETVEVEKSPELIVGNAISAVEGKDATDPTISSKWMQKFRKGRDSISSNSGDFVIGGVLFGAMVIVKMVSGLFKFAKEATKGKMTLSEGYKLGQEAFESEKKNEK